MEDPRLDQRCRSALLQAKRYAAEIVDSIISPFDGAHKIGSELGDCYDFLGQDLDLVDLLGAFSGYADSYQETLLDPAKKQQVDSDVVESARQFIQLAAESDIA